MFFRAVQCCVPSQHNGVWPQSRPAQAEVTPKRAGISPLLGPTESGRGMAHMSLRRIHSSCPSFCHPPLDFLQPLIGCQPNTTTASRSESQVKSPVTRNPLCNNIKPASPIDSGPPWKTWRACHAESTYRPSDQPHPLTVDRLGKHGAPATWNPLEHHQSSVKR